MKMRYRFLREMLYEKERRAALERSEDALKNAAGCLKTAGFLDNAGQCDDEANRIAQYLSGGTRPLA